MVAVSKSPSAVAGVVDEYVVWLGKQPLSDRSRDSYRAQVVAFVEWLAGFDDPAGALADGPVRDWAVRDYKRFLKTKRRLSPASVNQALAAIDNFYRSRAIGRPDVGREPAAQSAPRALDEDDQRRLLRAVDRWPVARDRAIVSLLLYTGLRLTEIADLELDDLAMSARKGEVTVRSGKGDVFRQVPLNSACREVLSEWFTERRQLLDAKNTESEAVWVSRLGRPLSSRSISNVITRLADDAGIEGLSPHVLRHTFVTNLIRSGKDVVLVAELAGHRNLDTTRRYSLPTEADRADAVEDVIVELYWPGRVDRGTSNGPPGTNGGSSTGPKNEAIPSTYLGGTLRGQRPSVPILHTRSGTVPTSGDDGAGLGACGPLDITARNDDAEHLGTGDMRGMGER